MSELKDNFVKVGFSEQEAEELITKISPAEIKRLSLLGPPELALKTKILRSQHLSSTSKPKLKPKLKEASPNPEDATHTMVFKRASLPKSTIGTEKATQTQEVKLDLSASPSVDDAVTTPPPPPSPKAPSPKAPGTTLRKPSADIEEEESLPTMSFKRTALPTASANLSQATQQNPAFKLTKPNKGGSKTSPPPETAQGKLTLPGANKKSMLQPAGSLKASQTTPSQELENTTLKAPGSRLVAPKPAKPTDEIDLETINTIQVNRSQVPGAAVELDTIRKKTDQKAITPPGGGLNFQDNKMLIPGGASKLPDDIPLPGTLLQESKLKTNMPGGASKAPGNISTAPSDSPEISKTSEISTNNAVPSKTIELKSSAKISAPGTTKPIAESGQKKSVNLDERPQTSVRANIKNLKKKKKKKSKLAVIAMAMLALLVVAGLYLLNSDILGSEEDTVAEAKPKKEKVVSKAVDKANAEPKEVATPTKAPSPTTNNKPPQKTIVLPEQREWSVSMNNKVDFNLSSSLKDHWTTELWFSLKDLKANKNINLISLNSGQIKVQMTPDSKIQLAEKELIGTTDKGIRTFNTHYHLAISYKKGILELFINGKAQFQEQIETLDLKSFSLGSNLNPITYDEILISHSSKYPLAKNFIPQRTFSIEDDTYLYIPVEIEKDKKHINIYEQGQTISYEIGSGEWQNTAKQIMAVEELLLEIASPKSKNTTVR